MAKLEEEKITDYSNELQHLFIQIMVSSPELYTRCQNIVKESYFDKRLQKSVKYIKDYSEEYKSVPTPLQIKATTGHMFEELEIRRDTGDWFLKEIEGFCRHKEIEDIILSGMDAIEHGRYSILEDRIKHAMTISLQNDLGTDYFADPRTRLERIRDKQNVISTGWRTLDSKLYGGWGRQTLNIFAGQPGAGKSLFLQNISLNYMEMGLNVVYITLELAEELVSMRFDSMVTGYATKEIFRKMDEVELRLHAYKKDRKPGSLRIKKFPEGGTCVNDIRAYLKEYEIQTGQRPDVVAVDYLDLLAPNDKRINPSDLFVKDKFTSEELRALSFEWNVICVTASQLNRSSIEAVDFDQSHIAGGISKLNTADNLMAIMGTPSMREKGEYQIQFLKTRSSSGVGSKVNLQFSPETLRIRDYDDDGAYKPQSRDDLAASIKSRNQSTTVKSAQKELSNAEIQRNGADLLSSMKLSED